MITAALIHKYGYAEGITEIDGKLVEWPSSLGAKPRAATIAAAVAQYKAYIAPLNALRANLLPTEDIAIVARKLEDIIDHLENGTPLSTEAKDWMTNRKTMRV